MSRFHRPLPANRRHAAAAMAQLECRGQERSAGPRTAMLGPDAFALALADLPTEPLPVAGAEWWWEQLSAAGGS